jgi:mannitol 2-dehydrogenase
VIEPNDPNWNRLTGQSKKARENPAAWLDMRDIYGDLANAPSFVGAFTKSLNSLWLLGTKATLEAYLADRL